MPAVPDLAALVGVPGDGEWVRHRQIDVDQPCRSNAPVALRCPGRRRRGRVLTGLERGHDGGEDRMVLLLVVAAAFGLGCVEQVHDGRALPDAGDLVGVGVGVLRAGVRGVRRDRAVDDEEVYDHGAV